MLPFVIRVTSLHIYPVKSLRGFEVNEAAVERRGLAHDRRFMVVDSTGRFMTQRECPRMARVETKILSADLILAHETSQVWIPLDGDGERLQVRVWNSDVRAVHVPGADEFLSDALQSPCRLVRMPSTTQRATEPEHSLPGDHVSFADGYPVLLANAASLDDLNARMEEPALMARFRPNIVIEGAEPWVEDAMATILVGTTTYRNAKPCLRCSVTTLDPLTGDSLGAEPLKTMARFRRWEKGVRFGINLIPDSDGMVRIGDEVAYNE